MDKWDASSENGPRRVDRRATAAIDTAHRREFVDKIQRRARELREREAAAERVRPGSQGATTKG
jgi:hypothetical protein